MNEIIVEVDPKALLIRVWLEAVDPVNKSGIRELLCTCGLSGVRAEYLKNNPPTLKFEVNER